MRNYEETRSLKIIVRFAHEMNGAWYRWGQQPALYRATWKRFATLLRANTLYATTMWAPNEGYGYPFLGGRLGRWGLALRALGPGAVGWGWGCVWRAYLAGRPGC